MLKTILKNIDRVRIIAENSDKKGNFSQIDKDLMLDKIRELYEDILFVDVYDEESSSTIYFDDAEVTSQKSISQVEYESTLPHEVVQERQPQEQEIAQMQEVVQAQELLEQPIIQEHQMPEEEIVVYQSEEEDDIFDAVQDSIAISEIEALMDQQVKEIIIRDVFENNEVEFRETLSVLDKEIDFDNAILYLQEQPLNFSSPSMELLVDILEKRF